MNLTIDDLWSLLFPWQAVNRNLTGVSNEWLAWAKGEFESFEQNAAVPYVLRILRVACAIHRDEYDGKGLEAVLFFQIAQKAFSVFAGNNANNIFHLALSQIKADKFIEEYKVANTEHPYTITLVDISIQGRQCLRQCGALKEPPDIKPEELKTLSPYENDADEKIYPDDLNGGDLPSKNMNSDLISTTPLKGRTKAEPQVYKTIKQCANNFDSVLILGETGTGKGHLAQQLCDTAKVGKTPFKSVNCANFSPHLLSDELFGHKKGAFSEATKDRDGIIKATVGGTLFLDEIGDLAPDCRASLLRFFDSGEIRPVGSDKIETLVTPVRIIAATNKPESELLSERCDFVHRFKTIIRLSPLREKRDEIPELVKKFFKDAKKSLNSKKTLRLAMNAPDVVQRYDYAWPGNIRELQTAVENAVKAFKMTPQNKSLSGQDIISALPDRFIKDV